jgi:hypothetical protein
MTTINPEADDICLECGHRRGDHDGIGCNARLPNGDPCLCRTCVDMPNSKPSSLPHFIRGTPLAIWQSNNCSRCVFADEKKVGTGDPCCTRLNGPDPLGAICLARRGKR